MKKPANPETPTLSRTTVVKFGPVARFRTLEGDLEIVKAAAQQRGQTLSAYLRDAAMAHALADLHCDTRSQAVRKIRRNPVEAKDL